MKKTFSFVFIFLVVVFVILFMRYKEVRKYNLELMKFNSEYEIFNEEKINGLDITTAISKAINNNEKYAVSKDDKGLFDTDDINCVEVYIGMIVDDAGNTKEYRMEEIDKVGINDFVTLYANAHFKCEDIKYNSQTGKVKSLTFVELED